MVNSELVNRILWKPVDSGADELLIISGNATANMASWFIKNIEGYTKSKVKMHLAVGMPLAFGIGQAVHDGFKELMKNTYSSVIDEFVCGYVYEGVPVDARLYIWMKNGNPVVAFNGSANFTQLDFSTNRIGYMTECDPVRALEYYRKIENSTCYCNNNEIEDIIVVLPTKNKGSNAAESMTLSLLSRNGDVGKRSGLNWGQRDGREPNQGYIPLPIDKAQSGFFPLGKQHFTVVTDDRHQLILRVEQQFDKAITTPLNNALIGEYFRNRLGLANGAFVTKEDLIAYGRTDVTFYKIDEEQYYMDFGVK